MMVGSASHHSLPTLPLAPCLTYSRCSISCRCESSIGIRFLVWFSASGLLWGALNFVPLGPSPRESNLVAWAWPAWPVWPGPGDVEAPRVPSAALAENRYVDAHDENSERPESFLESHREANGRDLPSVSVLGLDRRFPTEEPCGLALRDQSI